MLLHDIVDDVVFHGEEVRGMDVDGTVECLMDGRRFDVREAHVSVHVEVDGVATETEGLTGVEHLFGAHAHRGLV